MTVAKVVELIGSSPESWEGSAKNAIAEAAKTVRGIESVYVKRCTAKVEKNKIVEYRAVVKIARERLKLSILKTTIWRCARSNCLSMPWNYSSLTSA